VSQKQIAQQGNSGGMGMLPLSEKRQRFLTTRTVHVCYGAGKYAHLAAAFYGKRGKSSGSSAL
jgi:hypothetical protein